MTENTQYKWRQRKKRNSMITVWIIAVIIISAVGTFAYEGLKVGTPANVAKKYMEQVIGVDEYEMTSGTRSLNADNLFQQEFTVKYTSDGKEEVRKLNLVQQESKKYGIFEQWDLEKQDAGDMIEMELIAPVHSQVLIDGVAPTDSEIKVDQAISAGAVCYDLTGVKVGAKLQVNGLPFDSYEATVSKEDTELDLREQLVIGSNAQTQMEEMGKTMLNELFTALVQGQEVESLSKLFDQTPNKANLFKALKENLYDGDKLKVTSMTFKDFKPEFGEVYYPGTGEDAYIGMDLKLAYNCEYTVSKKKQNAANEAKLSFRYIDGECVVTAMEVQNPISK